MKLSSFSLEEVLFKIENGIHFEAEICSGAFYIKIEDYVPFVSCSIHNGHRLRPELQKKCSLSEAERLYEEDPQTYEFISSMPIVLSANDSRYEYDLNRDKDNCIYEDAWGKKVWNTALNQDEKNISINKYQSFYKILDALLVKLKSKYKSIIVYDIHSYNYKRIETESPVFNIGTENIDIKTYSKDINYWLRQLRKIQLPGIEMSVEENAVFKGRGYLLKHITKNHRNVLVLATEVKKIYCNENTGEFYPHIINEISRQFKKAIINTSAQFARNYTNLTVIKNNRLLSSELEPGLIETDKQLYRLVKNFEILSMINPINIEQEKAKFFKARFNINPDFRYRNMVIDTHEFKRKLYKIPVERINDISLRILYQDVIDSYADKIDVIASIGTDKFLYNSLRYFGEPSVQDIEKANFLLNCSEDTDKKEEATIDAYAAKEYLSNSLKDYGFKCNISVTKHIASKVMVINSTKTVKIRKNSLFTQTSLNALAEHEVGVHMLTTINSGLQPLSVFNMGLPVNTSTQEGLAILSEYLSGNLNVGRLKMLALRVLMIDIMLKSFDFKRAFSFLMDTGTVTEEQAYYICVRIYRGGGFTKDYLYLSGFIDILERHKKKEKLDYLLIGKTSVKYISTIKEMIERRVLLPPKFKTKSYINPVENNQILDYILSCIIK